MHYWEVFGTLKWGVICDGMAQAYLSGAERNVERATIGRRASETEIDLLCLLAPRRGAGLMAGQRADPDDLLVDAVAGYLREQALPQLQGQAAFHARVAANALDIVRRAAGAGARPPKRPSAARLRALLGTDGSLAELKPAAVPAHRQRRDGPATTPALAAHLWARDAGQAGGRPARL